MNQQRPPWIAVACAAGSLLMLTACSTICKKNVEECLPIITCQPMDTCVTTNEDAHFEVKAFGPNLTFRWFFEDSSNAVTAVANGTSPQLTVSTNILNRYGSYWCLISSECDKGLMESRTRPAQLRMLMLAGLEQGLLQPSTVGSNLCANPICGLLNFNNSKVGYKPNGQAHCAITLTTDSAGFSPVNINTYEALYRYGGQPYQCGCLTNFPPDQKGFAVPVSTATYVFTIYFKSACPPMNTPFYLKVNFGP